MKLGKSLVIIFVLASLFRNDPCVSASATIVSPNGGEILCPGDGFIIDVSFKDISFSDLRLNYSPDSGNTWLPMYLNSHVVDEHGILIMYAYEWIVPYMPSDDCLLKVSDRQNNELDISDSTFTIASFENDTTYTDEYGVRYTLALDKSNYTPNDTVKMLYEIRYPGVSSIVLKFGSTQEYDFWSTNWRWSKGKMFFQILQDKSIGGQNQYLIYSTSRPRHFSSYLSHIFGHFI